MKSCPTCNRTFEDTFSFCLMDGAVLSAPFDPANEQFTPQTREAAPPRTEALSAPTAPAPEVQPQQTTIRAPVPEIPAFAPRESAARPPSNRTDDFEFSRNVRDGRERLGRFSMVGLSICGVFCGAVALLFIGGSLYSWNPVPLLPAAIFGLAAGAFWRGILVARKKARL